MSDEPIFAAVNLSDPAHRRAIEEAKRSLGEFRKLCELSNQSGALVFVKAEIHEGDHHALLWFSNACPVENGFKADIFEVPSEFRSLKAGQRVEIRVEDVMDWMVNDDGRLQGGFSLRYQRERLAPEKRGQFDIRIGVSEYV